MLSFLYHGRTRPCKALTPIAAVKSASTPSESNTSAETTVRLPYGLASPTRLSLPLAPRTIVSIMTSTDPALAALLLGPDIAHHLYGESRDSLEVQIADLSPANTPFLARLRDILTHCCSTLGAEATFVHIMLPMAIGQYLVNGEVNTPLVEVKTTCTTLQSDLCGDDLRPEYEEIQEYPEELKEQVVRLYNKGVKANFIAALYNIGSPKLVHSWGDWKFRPVAEMERLTARRAQILALIEQGQPYKNIASILNIKYKSILEILGKSYGTVYSRAAYEQVMQQMRQYKVKSQVSKNTGVSLYIMKKWLSGRDVPNEEFIVDDEEGSAEAKRAAIETYYETRDVEKAAEVGAVDTETVKKWILTFQDSTKKAKRRRRRRIRTLVTDGY